MSADNPTKLTTRSPNWRVIYTNIVGIGFGSNDMRLMCGFDQDLAHPGSDVLEEAVVVMSPQSAKLLAHSLTAVLGAFELANGPIPLPGDKIAKIDAEIAAQAAKHKKAGSNPATS